MVFRPLAGCGLFPSGRCLRHGLSGVSVPLRGVGCFDDDIHCRGDHRVSVPLRGVGCFPMPMKKLLSSGCFRPLAGCGLFPSAFASRTVPSRSFRPLAGCGLFRLLIALNRGSMRFRPLAGCGLFPSAQESMDIKKVSVPLRGVGCFCADPVQRHC